LALEGFNAYEKFIIFRFDEDDFYQDYLHIAHRLTQWYYNEEARPLMESMGLKEPRLENFTAVIDDVRAYLSDHFLHPKSDVIQGVKDILDEKAKGEGLPENVSKSDLTEFENGFTIFAKEDKSQKRGAEETVTIAFLLKQTDQDSPLVGIFGDLVLAYRDRRCRGEQSSVECGKVRHLLRKVDEEASTYEESLLKLRSHMQRVTIHQDWLNYRQHLATLAAKLGYPAMSGGELVASALNARILGCRYENEELARGWTCSSAAPTFTSSGIGYTLNGEGWDLMLSKSDQEETFQRMMRGSFQGGQVSTARNAD